MNEREGFTGGQVLLALLGGAAVGAVTALLLAPRSGQQARARLRELAQDSKEKASRLPTAVSQAAGAAREAFAGAMERV